MNQSTRESLNSSQSSKPVGLLSFNAEGNTRGDLNSNWSSELIGLLSLNVKTGQIESSKMATQFDKATLQQS